MLQTNSIQYALSNNPNRYLRSDIKHLGEIMTMYRVVAAIVGLALMIAAYLLAQL